MEGGRPERRKSRQESTGKESGKEKTGQTLRNTTKAVLKEMETKKD